MENDISIDIIKQELNNPDFQEKLLTKVKHFTKITDEENKLIESLLESSYKDKHELKLESLNLLLSLFQKNKILHDYITKLILIKDGDESKLFEKVAQSAKTIEKCKATVERKLNQGSSQVLQFQPTISSLCREATS